MDLKNCLLLCLLLSTFSATAEMQKWIDESGQVHYGEKPPHGVRTERIDTGGANIIDTSDQRRRTRAFSEEMESRQAYREKQAEKEERQVKQYQKRCERTKRKLGTYRQKVPVYTTEADGSRNYIEDNERAEMIAKLEQDIRRYCR